MQEAYNFIIREKNNRRAEVEELAGQYYCLEEAMEIFKVSSQTVRKELSEGRLLGVKIGGKWLISKESVNERLKTRLSQKGII